MTTNSKSQTDKAGSPAEAASLPDRASVLTKIELLREREIVLADRHTKNASDLNAVRAKIEAWTRLDDALRIAEEIANDDPPGA